MRISTLGRALAAPGGFLLTLALVAGCSRGGGPAQVVAPPPPPPPLVADTPLHALEVLRTTWVARDTVAYRRMLTTDFHATFAVLGDLLATVPVTDWFLWQEVTSTRLLLHAPTTAVALTLTPRYADHATPGLDGRTHRLVVADYVLDVDRAPATSVRAVGNAVFYFVRGDAAQLQPEYGLAPDSTRWYLEGWTDPTPLVTLPGPPPAPARASAIALTWGRIKGWAMGLDFGTIFPD